MKWTIFAIIFLLDLTRVHPKCSDLSSVEEIQQIDRENNFDHQFGQRRSQQVQDNFEALSSDSIPVTPPPSIKSRINFGKKKRNLIPTTAVPLNEVELPEENLDQDPSPTFRVIGRVLNKARGQGHPSQSYGPSSDIMGLNGDNFLLRLFRLLLSLPNLTLSILQPILHRLAHTSARVTHKAAGVSEKVSRHLPAIAETGGELLNILTRTFGQVTGSSLYTFSQLASRAAIAQDNFNARTLPRTFEIVRGVNEGVTNTLGTIAEGVADTSHIIRTGVVDAARPTKELVSRLAHGGRQFKSQVVGRGGYNTIDDAITPPPLVGYVRKRRRRHDNDDYSN